MNVTVTTLFDRELKKVFAEKKEILNFLLNHERKKLCIANICRELKAVEFTTLTTNRQLLELVVKDFSMLFAKAAIKQKEEQLLSQAERFRIEQENRQIEEQMKELESLDAGVLNTEIKRIQPDDYTVSV